MSCYSYRNYQRAYYTSTKLNVFNFKCHAHCILVRILIYIYLFQYMYICTCFNCLLINNWYWTCSVMFSKIETKKNQEFYIWWNSIENYIATMELWIK